MDYATLVLNINDREKEFMSNINKEEYIEFLQNTSSMLIQKIDLISSANKDFQKRIIEMSNVLKDSITDFYTFTIGYY